jgi:hypothetical protein
MNPLVVIEGDNQAVAAARASLEARGWHVVDGWDTSTKDRPPRHRICTGIVENETDAAHAVLAAIRGDGVLIAARADRDVIDRLCDDLRRLSPVDHQVVSNTKRNHLTSEHWTLLRLLLDGSTLGQAARLLHLSRRTTDRRLAACRQAFGVTSTAEVLLAARRQESQQTLTTDVQAAR